MNYQSNVRKLVETQDNKNLDEQTNSEDEEFEEQLESFRVNLDAGLEVLDRQESGYDYSNTNQKKYKSIAYRSHLLDSIYDTQNYNEYSKLVSEYKEANG